MALRRAHVLPKLAGDAQREAYATKSLIDHMEERGLTPGFITDIVQVMADGTEVRYQSRAFRLGLRPTVRRAPTAETVDVGDAEPSGATPRHYQYCGFRPHSVPYWVAVTFLLGAVLFTVGSFSWMTPIGDTALGADESQVVDWVSLPFFVGSLLFTAGAYLTLVEVLNANLQVEIARGSSLTPNCSTHRRREMEERRKRDVGARGGTASGAALGAAGAELRARGFGESLLHASPVAESVEEVPPAADVAVDVTDDMTVGAAREALFVETSRRELFDGRTAIKWWGWQPDSLLFWAALTQLCGALSFNLSTGCGLPGLTHGHAQEVHLVYIPSLLGSLCFSAACCVFLAEVTHSYNVLRPPIELSLSYFVTLLNLIGSLLFAVASSFYFVQVTDGLLEAGGKWGWEFQVSEWGVRFTFGVGSACFMFAALISFPELLND